jgi:hypothetical protein
MERFCTYGSFLCSVRLVEWNEPVPRKRIFRLDAECPRSTESVEPPRSAELASPLISFSPEKISGRATRPLQPYPLLTFSLVSLRPSFLAAVGVRFPSRGGAQRKLASGGGRGKQAAVVGERRRWAGGGRQAAAVAENREQRRPRQDLSCSRLPFVAIWFFAYCCREIWIK